MTILFSLSACSHQTNDSEGGDLTRGEVEFLSSRMAMAVEAAMPVLKHKLVNRYITTLGQAMVSRNKEMPPLPYEFRVLKSNDVLVFSLPGGIVYITLGAIRHVELEGQLAAAIAFELAHQQLNHPLIRWRKILNANRGQPMQLDFAGDWDARFLGERGALYYEPSMEEEADRLALVVMYYAKFDPRLYVSYLQLLKKTELSDPTIMRDTLSIHSPTTTRLAWAKEALVSLPPLKDANVSSPAFEELKMILKEAQKKGDKGSETKKEKK